MSKEEVTAKKELEERQQWWWLAEKKRSTRLDYLRKGVWPKGPKGVMYLPGIKVNIERAELYTEAWAENESDPTTIRRAKAIAHILDNSTIFIQDKSQIVGYISGLPHELHWAPEVAFVGNEEIYNDRTVIPEPEEESLKKIREINDYWGPRTELTQILWKLSPEDVMKLATYFLGWGSPLSGGYSTKQYDWWLPRGFNGVLKEINQKIAEAQDKLYQGVPEPEDYVYYEKLEEWNSMKIALEAGIRWAQRYARLAKIIAENFETDPDRKKELLRIAETCEKVPANPPEHFWESLQFDWFIQTLVRVEQYEGAWPARPDYWHWPYYEKDVIKEKNLTREEAIDLVGEFIINAYGLGAFFGTSAKESLQGIQATWVWTLGGVDEDGSDACNDLTDLFLETARLVRISNPTFGFRYHPNARIQTLREVFECIRQGLGYPSMRNDPILIANAMHWHKHPLKEARTWVHQACMSPCPTTKWGCQPTRMANATIIASKAMEYALFDGFDPVLKMQMGPHTGDATQFKDFEEFYQAWHYQIKWLMDLYARLIGGGRVHHAKIQPRPMLSSLDERCVDLGVDASDPSERGN